MKLLLAWIAILVLLLLPATSLEALGPPVLLKESRGGLAGAPGGCPLVPSLAGDCANYRWYNLCSGYIWLYATGGRGEYVGTQFGGPEQPCVAPGNVVERMITYWRNVVPNYNQTVDVFLDGDSDGNGCPDGVLASHINLDRGLRWNCSSVNTVIPSGVFHSIVRLGRDGGTPTLVTDGPFSDRCDPLGVPRSFYYGINLSLCIAWRGPTSRHDNFLSWLIVDAAPTGTRGASWGEIKGLFR